MNRHIDIDTLSRYLLNRLTQDEETAVHICGIVQNAPAGLMP